MRESDRARNWGERHKRNIRPQRNACLDRRHHCRARSPARGNPESPRPAVSPAVCTASGANAATAVVAVALPAVATHGHRRKKKKKTSLWPTPEDALPTPKASPQRGQPLVEPRGDAVACAHHLGAVGKDPAGALHIVVPVGQADEDSQRVCSGLRRALDPAVAALGANAGTPRRRARAKGQPPSPRARVQTETETPKGGVGAPLATRAA